MKISIKGKISFLVIFALMLSVIILASIFIYTIKQKAKADLETYRQEEIDKVRLSLQSYVNLAYQSVEVTYGNIENKEFIEKLYGLRLKNVIDIARATLERRSKQVQNGELSLAAAQQLAMKEIESMRYDNGTGYIWINDTTLPYPSMIMHPTVPQTNGLVLDDPKYNCAMGKKQNLFQAMVEVCQAKKEGFVNYVWPKPTPDGLIPDVKKLSYVGLFEEWGWVLGTGIYLDDVEKDVISSILEDVRNLKYNNGEGYFWINTTQLPYPVMVMNPIQPELSGKSLNAAQYNSVKETKRNFYQVLTEQAVANGSTYVEYLWPKPGSEHQETKLSFARHFEPLGWVIGTGVYIDNIDKIIAAKEQVLMEQINSFIINIILVSLLLIGGGIIIALFLSGTMAKAIYVVKERLQDLALGRSIGKVDIKQKDEIGAMIDSLNNLVDGIDSYASFAREIGKGNLQAEFNPLSEEDALGNSLIKMRDELKEVAEQEKIRKWFNEGIALFSEILRKNNHDLQGLCLQVTSQLVKYMKANQGAFYLLEKEGEEEACIILKACYAFNRQKFIDKKIAIGEGLVGQVVLEKDYIYMTDIPQDYVKITSGLGGATPTALIVIPLMNNEEVLGVLELASFSLIGSHEIEFLLKIAESVGSTVSSVKVNDVTRHLLEESQQLAEEIKSQEEELRQNQEELMATQEELSRKLQEVEREKALLEQELLHLKEDAAYKSKEE